MTIPMFFEEFRLISLGPPSSFGRTSTGKRCCPIRNARPRDEGAPDDEDALEPEGVFVPNGLFVEERQEGGVELVGVAHIDSVRSTHHYVQVAAGNRGVGTCS